MAGDNGAGFIYEHRIGPAPLPDGSGYLGDLSLIMGASISGIGVKRPIGHLSIRSAGQPDFAVDLPLGWEF
jgi:hypothetical protein